MPKPYLITKSLLHKEFIKNYRRVSQEKPNANAIRMICKETPRYRAIHYSCFNEIKIYSRSISPKYWGNSNGNIPILLFDEDMLGKAIHRSQAIQSIIYAWAIDINNCYGTSLDIQSSHELKHKFQQDSAFPCITYLAYDSDLHRDFSSLVAFILTVKRFLD